MPLSDLSVLVVDDEPDLCEIVRRILTREQATVRIASGRSGAQKAIAERPDGFDLVVTDLRLDDGTGAEVAALAKEARPDGLVLFMSGLPYFDDSVTQLGNEAPVIAKPFKPGELLEAIDVLLRRAGRPGV